MLCIQLVGYKDWCLQIIIITFLIKKMVSYMQNLFVYDQITS